MKHHSFQLLALSLLISSCTLQPLPSDPIPPEASTTPSPEAKPTSTPTTDPETTPVPTPKPSRTPQTIDPLILKRIPPPRTTGTLRGQVFVEGIPVSHSVEIQMSLKGETFSTYTDNSGFYEFRKIPIDETVSLKVNHRAYTRGWESFIFQANPETQIKNLRTELWKKVKNYQDITTFNGKVFNDDFKPVDGVKIKVRSLNESVPYEREFLTVGGTYAFNSAPTGVQVEIIATKPGFTTRRRVEVLKNGPGVNGNKYDFGTDGTPYGYGSTANALTDKPEVTAVTPGRNSSEVEQNTPFILSFSEPVEKSTVEDNFSIRAFNSRTLSVDIGNSEHTLIGSGDVSVTTGNLIWDKEAFNIIWNEEATKVTFSFKDGLALPSEQDPNFVPDYQVVFAPQNGDRLITDQSGVSRESNHFKLTDGPLEESYKFSIQLDQTPPKVDKAFAATFENSDPLGDAIKVNFSEPMAFFTKSRVIAAGMDDKVESIIKSPAGYPTGENATLNSAALNYSVIIRQPGNGPIKFHGKWGDLGGTAQYDPLNQRTIILKPPITTLNKEVASVPNNGDTLTGTIWFDDKTSETFSIAIADGTSFNSLINALNGLSTGTPFSIESVDNVIAANANFNISLAKGAKNSSDTKTIYAFKIDGGSAANALNIFANKPLWVFPGSSPGVAADLYQPGETIELEVGAEIRDPAGNQIDSENRTLTIIAS